MSQKHELKRKQSVFRDLFDFLMESKKWWLIPIVVVTLLLGILILLGGSSAAPFIYTLF
jgi:hypothetical protein